MRSILEVVILLTIFCITARAQNILQNVSLVGHWTNGPSKAVAVSGNYAYIGNQDFMEILNISSPTSTPVLVGKISLGNPANGIIVSGNYAFAATGNGGLQILDISNPSNPTRVSSFSDFLYTLQSVSVSGNYAYVCDLENGLAVLDISDPAHPQKVGIYSTNGYA